MIINLVNHDLVVDNEALTNCFVIDIFSIVVNVLFYFILFLFLLFNYFESKTPIIQN